MFYLMRQKSIVVALAGLLACLLLTGCSSQSSLTLNRPILGLFGGNEPNDANIPVLQATGKAAETLAGQLAANMQTAQGRLAETMKYNAWAYLVLIGVFVAGLIFWGFTRSRYGWVLPAAAVAGIGLITAFAEYARYINAGILVVAGALLVWKAIEYHKERDIELKKNGGP